MQKTDHEVFAAQGKAGPSLQQGELIGIPHQIHAPTQLVAGV